MRKNKKLEIIGTCYICNKKVTNIQLQANLIWYIGKGMYRHKKCKPKSK